MHQKLNYFEIVIDNSYPRVHLKDDFFILLVSAFGAC